MKLYHLMFISGDSTTREDSYLGSYSSEEKREEAITRHRACAKSCFYAPFQEGGHDNGEFVKFELDLDVDALEKRLNLYMPKITP